MKEKLLSALFCLVAMGVLAKTSCVIEQWETVLVLREETSLSIREFKRIRILDEEGYKNAVYQDYYDSFRKVKSVHYTIYDSQNKKVRRFTKADAIDVKLNSSYEIGDIRILVIDPNYRNYPFTIELEVEIGYSGFLTFPTWMPRFTPDMEVKQATLRLECFKEFQFRYRELNGVANPEVSESEKMKSYTWKIENLAAQAKHLTYKSFVANQPRVHLSPVRFTLDRSSGSFESWQSFGEWFLTLNEGRNLISDKTKSELDHFKTSYGQDRKALVNAVYRYMQGRTRYISIQLGIGGFQTIPSDEVDKNGYGDCKALTNYMKSMLEYLNIPSNYVLVRAGSDVPEILPDFPSNQFNHLFLAVNTSTDTLWYECTAQTSPPAYIGTFTDDRYVLWVEKNNSQVLRTPRMNADESVRSVVSSGSVEVNGDVTLTMQINQSGMFADEMLAYQNLSENRVEKINYSRFHYKDFTIKSFNYKIPDSLKALLNLNYELRVNGVANNLGSKMIIPLNLLTPLANQLNIDILNKISEVRRAFTLEDKVHLTLPAGYRVETLPKHINHKWDFGSIEIKVYGDENNVLIMERKAVIEKGNYQNESFERFYDMVKKIRSLEQTKVVATKKT